MPDFRRHHAKCLDIASNTIGRSHLPSRRERRFRRFRSIERWAPSLSTVDYIAAGFDSAGFRLIARRADFDTRLADRHAEGAYFIVCSSASCIANFDASFRSRVY